MQIFPCCCCGTQAVQHQNFIPAFDKLVILGKINKFLCSGKLGLALLVTGLALIPFTGGLSLITLIPALTSLIPVSVGIGVGSSLVTAGIFVLLCSAMHRIFDSAKRELQHSQSGSKNSSADITNAS